jgi:centromere protein B
MGRFFHHYDPNSFQKLESALVACFKQAHETNVSIDGTHLKEKAYITAHLGTAKFSASNGWINRFRRRHNIVYRNYQVRAGGLNQKLQKTGKLLTTARN